MNARERWPHVAVIAGCIAALIGAIDPMEGSLLILLGSGLIALGTRLGQSTPRLIAYRSWTFVLIAIGVGALWGLSAVGGIGGASGKPMWWGVLILPYLAGWLMVMWGRGMPRWFSMLGLVIGLWYLAIPIMILARADPSGDAGGRDNHAVLGLGLIGLLTIAGCATRLRRRARTPV